MLSRNRFLLILALGFLCLSPAMVQAMETAQTPTPFLRAPLPNSFGTLAAGELDPSFGSGGKQVTSFTDPITVLGGITMDSAGRVIAVGRNGITMNAGWVMARYTTAGILDTTFGNAGTYTTFGGGQYDARAVMVQQADQKIVVGGLSPATGGRTQFQLVRYTPNSTPPNAQDTTFGSGGFVQTDFAGSTTSVEALAPDANNTIIAAGSSINSANVKQFVFARYLTTGAPDATFGNAGTYVTGINGNETLGTMFLQPDRKIIVVGNTLVGANSRCVIARYNADMPAVTALDTTFNGTGFQVFSFGASGDDTCFAGELAKDGSGKIIVAGTNASGGVQRVGLARFLSNGQLDINLNGTGKLTQAVGNGISVYGVSSYTNGKIAVGGQQWITPGTSSAFGLVRFNADGSLDNSYGVNGNVTTQFPGSTLDNLTEMVMQDDGKIVAAGSTFPNGGANSGFALARYLADPAATPTATPTATTTPAIATPTSTPTTPASPLTQRTYLPGANKNVSGQ